jgi:hypothetical protein
MPHRKDETTVKDEDRLPEARARALAKLPKLDPAHLEELLDLVIGEYVEFEFAVRNQTKVREEKGPRTPRGRGEERTFEGCSNPVSQVPVYATAARNMGTGERVLQHFARGLP